ncbi:AAA family ATPase [Caldiplasma sukawensis]
MENMLDYLNVKSLVSKVSEEIGRKVIGSRITVKMMFISLISNNHILLEGVPGLAKTMLASEFSSHLQMQFKRIQFTPDMLPSDITGNMIFNLETKKFEFRQGPIFTNILLADEINRTPAKVQSALLESMEEKHVSAGGNIYWLPNPFFVIATQNPIEQEGTFPLAEALMDRFIFRLILTYPSREEEINILSRSFSEKGRGTLINPELIDSMRASLNDVYVSQQIKEYMVDLMRKTREDSRIYVGASPRTTAKLMQAARACAMIEGRNYVIPEDVYFLAKPLLNHRLILRPEALMNEMDSGVEASYRIIEDILEKIGFTQ